MLSSLTNSYLWCAFLLLRCFSIPLGCLRIAHLALQPRALASTLKHERVTINASQNVKSPACVHIWSSHLVLVLHRCWADSSLAGWHWWGEWHFKKKLWCVNQAAEVRDQCWMAVVYLLEMGCRGFVTSFTTSLLNKLGIKGQALQKATKMSTITELSH